MFDRRHGTSKVTRPAVTPLGSLGNTNSASAVAGQPWDSPARLTPRWLLIRWRNAYPVRHLKPPWRCGAVDRPAGPPDPNPSGRTDHRRLRPGGRGRVRAHAEPRADHRARQAAVPPALAAALGRRSRHAVGPRGGHPRLDDRLDGADAPTRRDATAPRPQDRPACRGARARPAAFAGGLDRCRGPSRAATLLPAGRPVVGLGPTANWSQKIWPAERFAALFHALSDGPLPGAIPAVFAGPGEAERTMAAPLLAALPDAIDLVGRLSVPEASACLARCALFAGNDSGLMHLAAPSGTATLGLFGPTPVQEVRSSRTAGHNGRFRQRPHEGPVR